MQSAALKKIEQILTPGTLGQKYEQITLFLASGDSTLFDGDVNWKLTLPLNEQVLKGDAESLDQAFMQVRALMEEIMKNTSLSEKVVLAVEDKQP